LSESERKVDKYAEKTQQLKNMRDGLKDDNEKVFLISIYKQFSYKLSKKIERL